MDRSAKPSASVSARRLYAAGSHRYLVSMRLLLSIALASALSLHSVSPASGPAPLVDDSAYLVEHHDGKTPDSARELARVIIPSAWSKGREWRCLDELWTHESEWRYRADNPYSSAYGIPQILGLSDDLSPAEQILRGVRYIEHRYDTPCGAWDFWQDHSWY